MDFDPARTDLIEAVLEPLPRPGEARPVLEAILAGAADRISPGEENLIPAVTTRMRRLAPGFSARRRWAFIACLSTWAVLTWLAWLSPEARRELADIRLAGSAEWSMQSFDEDKPPPAFFHPGGDDIEEGWDRLMDEIYAQQRARMPGVDWSVVGSHYDPLGRWKAVWVEEPDNPALYFRWAVLHAGNFSPTEDVDAWPSGFVETGERLDSGNGWFRYAYAIDLAKQAFGRESAKTSVTDPEKMRQALAELERASALPRWDDYRATLFRRETGAWPVALDLPDQLISTIVFGYRLYGLHRTDGDELRALVRLSLETSADDPDPVALDRAAGRFTDLRAKWGKLETGYAGREEQRRMIGEGAAVLANAYDKRGDGLKATSWSHLAEEMERLAGAAPPDYYHQSHLARVVAGNGNLISSEPEERGIRAGMMAEYVMWERLMFRALAFFLAMVGLGFLLILGRGRKGVLAARFQGLLTVRDRSVLLLAGCGIPAGVYFAATRFMPSAREESISAWVSFLMLSQAAGMLMAMFLITMSLGRWLLVRRAAVLGFRKTSIAMDLGFIAFCLAWIPVAGSVQWTVAKLDLAPAWSGAMAALFVLLVTLFLAWQAFLSWQAKEAKRVHQAALLGLCLPAIAAAAISSLLAARAIHAQERQWVREMSLGSVHALENGLISPAQVQRAEQIRQAILKSLEP